jgi:hypothetical protein
VTLPETLQRQEINEFDLYNNFISPDEMKDTISDDFVTETPDMLISKSETKDVIASRYKILTNKPLGQFNTSFCRAFEVEDLKLDPQKKYALVYESNLPIRVEVINKLKRGMQANMISPLEMQILNLSGQERAMVAVVLPLYDDLISLEEYSKKHGAFEEDILIKNIIQPISAVLKKLQDLDVTHGSINSKNVFINQKGKIIVGECVSTTCGYNQASIYEPIERAAALKIGKGEKNLSVDYYALGVLSLHMQLGRSPLSANDLEKSLHHRYERGSYEYITGSFKFSPNMKNYYRGTMSDRFKDRWGAKQVFDWLKGARFSIIPSGDNVEANRSIIFNEKYFNNRRGLIYELAQNWDQAKKFLKDDKVIKWVERNLEDVVTAEKLQHILDMKSNSRGLVYLDDDEFVAKTLFILDPDKVIRLRDLAICGDAMGQAIALSLAKQNKEYLQYFAKLLAGNFFGSWLEQSPHNINPPSNAALTMGENLVEFVKKPDLGFGIERCMYDLVPTLSCQSPLVKSDYIMSVANLLGNIEYNTKNDSQELVDRHVSAFIASKLNITAPFKISTLAQYPKFANNKELINLAILASAQKGAGVKNLKKVGKIAAQRLYNVIDMINNVELKKKLAESLVSNAESGDLSELFKQIVDPNTIKADLKGFERALIQYRIYTKEINKCNNRKRTLQMGYNIGLRICVVISYLICSIVLIIVMSKAI